MELLIVTGLSGAGKSQAIHTLEDIGYFCFDNIPAELLLDFLERCRKAGRADGLPRCSTSAATPIRAM